MTNRALTLISLPAMAAALLMAAPAAAQTQCQPDDLFCAELRIGPGSAGIRIGGDPVPPPPPPVVIQPSPQPPTVYVLPSPPPPPPPPPVIYQPQPPTVYVQPAPPPPPQQVYVQPMQPMQPMPRRARNADRYPASATGLSLHVDGLFGDELAMGGGGVAFRLRPIPHIALDIGAGIYGGDDYNGLERVEVPVQADLLFFFNPGNRFQIYALVGVGASFGHADGWNQNTSRYDSRDYAHLGGEAGLGIEWRLSRSFALNLDVRGFIRQRVDSNPEPEFTELTSSGGSRSTDTSGGFVSRLGMTFYFAD